MLRIQRSNLPRALFAHLLDQIKTRNIGTWNTWRLRSPPDRTPSPTRREHFPQVVNANYSQSVLVFQRQECEERR